MICPCHFEKTTYIQVNEGNVKLLCDRAFYDAQQDGFVNVTDKIGIEKALRQPEALLVKIGIENKFEYNFKKMLSAKEHEIEKRQKQWNQAYTQIQQIIETLNFQSQEYFAKKIQEIKSYRQKLISIINFKQFVEIVNHKGYENQSSIIILTKNQTTEQKLNSYFDQLRKEKMSQNMMLEIEALMDDLKNSQIQFPPINQALEQITLLIAQHRKDLNYVADLTFPYLTWEQQKSNQNIISREKFEEIFNYISNNQWMKKILIYTSKIDKLIAKDFWERVQGKSNVLMVFKSQQNRVFGGYSNWKWDTQNEKNRQKEQEGKSFLFCIDQNNNIKYFPFKQEIKNAPITLDLNHGPIFGQNDLLIKDDFQMGYSNLGASYQADPQSQKNILFGGNINPNISECEVYQLII